MSSSMKLAVGDTRPNVTNHARLPLVGRMLNPVIARLLRLGLPISPMFLLTVRGRKTGQQHTTAVGLFEHDSKRYLFATFGEVNWVRNLRATGKAVLSRGRHRETIAAFELTPEQAAPFLKDAIAPLLKKPPRAWILRRHFKLLPDAPLNDFITEARRHPVFEVRGTAA